MGRRWAVTFNSAGVENSALSSLNLGNRQTAGQRVIALSNVGDPLGWYQGLNGAPVHLTPTLPPLRLKLAQPLGQKIPVGKSRMPDHSVRGILSELSKGPIR